MPARQRSSGGETRSHFDNGKQHHGHTSASLTSGRKCAPAAGGETYAIPNAAVADSCGEWPPAVCPSEPPSGLKWSAARVRLVAGRLGDSKGRG
jgi:hypothetical protein